MSDEDLIWGTPDDLEERIEALRRNHPGWSQRIFLLYALEQFRELDYNWRQGRPDDAADALTPGCLEALKNTEPPLNIPFRIQGIQLAAVGEEGEYDFIDVRFIGDRQQDDVGPGETIKYARFVRYRYEHSTDGETSMGESCPRCGGPVDPTSDWKCRYCDQKVNEESSGWLIEKVMDQGKYAT